jgi:hypothetical protein
MCGCRGGAAAPAARNQARQSVAAPAAAMRRIGAPGEKQEGDVLAQFIQEWGSPLTRNGRKYPVMQRGEMWWVAPKDIESHPKWWRRVEVSQ